MYNIRFKVFMYFVVNICLTLILQFIYQPLGLIGGVCFVLGLIYLIWYKINFNRKMDYIIEDEYNKRKFGN